MASKLQTIQGEAVNKLEHREINLLLGPLVSIATHASKSTASDSDSKLVSGVLASYREILDRFKKPLMFEDAEGNKLTEDEWHQYVRDELDVSR